MADIIQFEAQNSQERNQNQWPEEIYNCREVIIGPSNTNIRAIDFPQIIKLGLEPCSIIPNLVSVPNSFYSYLDSIGEGFFVFKDHIDFSNRFYLHSSKSFEYGQVPNFFSILKPSIVNTPVALLNVAVCNLNNIIQIDAGNIKMTQIKRSLVGRYNIGSEKDILLQHYKNLRKLSSFTNSMKNQLDEPVYESFRGYIKKSINISRQIVPMSKWFT